MKIIDISIPIHENMPTYMDNQGNKPKISTKTHGYITDTNIQLNIHTGTHVDAPLHMINDGETIETIGLERLVRPCKVFDLTSVNDRIKAEDLKDLPIEQDDFILLKTKNSFGETSAMEFIFLAEDGAQFLIEKGIQGVGIDTLGIERSQDNHPTHKGLFTNDIIIVEGLDLKEVKEGKYTMVCAPLKMVKTEAAPARVFLIEGAVGGV
ncbi:cyclase family protein [Halalkalibacter akibai]|uniref:Kynurenine formamidase n=1 Tax=Halalkalibacter akibai (strain ATCC 43226 / DSM 21942 / CIP 109018 / JCM 9157 / 1139) TaxID=1236973 RepID=W4QW18_HALA3|nr:cyclase family protein [Halalkalibacter akibai]GAE35504.1 metal-dependent hydrolase [Halalkalibacter akibai JCM 9157]